MAKDCEKGEEAREVMTAVGSRQRPEKLTTMASDYQLRRREQFAKYLTDLRLGVSIMRSGALIGRVDRAVVVVSQEVWL